MRMTVAAWIFFFAGFSVCAAQDPDPRNAEMERCRAGIVRIQDFLRNSCGDLFAPEGNSLPTRERKEVLWNCWASLIDLYCGLDSVQDSSSGFINLKNAEKNADFSRYYSAFLAQYRLALDFISLVERNPGLHKVLNEEVPEICIPKGTYAEFKLHFLNPKIATKFVALDAICQVFRIDAAAAGHLEEDRKCILDAGKGEGIKMTFANALKIAGEGIHSSIFPAQYKISEWMGDTKVYRKGRSLISPQQIEELAGMLEPGDFLLERREWYLSNIGLPGYWPHAALHIGTPEQRRSYFGNDPDVSAWVRKNGEESGDFEKLLAKSFPEKYRTSQEPESGHPPRVVEAMSEGVLFTSLEHSADCDSLAALRPRLPKLEKAAAIFKAFHLAGRPYDFDFDFLSDSSIVCTELVYKSYEPREGFKGMRFPLVEIAGRKVTPANEMARQYDREAGTDAQQSDLVAFLDASEKDSKAFSSGEEEFRKSWRRPKWHILTASGGDSEKALPKKP